MCHASHIVARRACRWWTGHTFPVFAASSDSNTAPHTTLVLFPPHCAGFEERYAEERRKLAASGERLATDMLAAESVKLRGIMTGPRASVEAVESELRRCGCETRLHRTRGQPLAAWMLSSRSRVGTRITETLARSPIARDPLP
jgi:hypothetical protein